MVEEYTDHPESKFENGDRCGTMRRRHLLADSIRYIGKESNELEETEALGVDDESYVEYQEPLGPRPDRAALADGADGGATVSSSFSITVSTDVVVSGRIQVARTERLGPSTSPLKRQFNLVQGDGETP